MCDPFSIALALTAAGSVSTYFGQQQAARAKESTFNAERQRQQDLSDQQTSRFQDSLDKTRAASSEESMANAAKARESTLASAIVPKGAESSYMPGSSSAPAVVATATESANAGGRAQSEGLARALAALGGTTDQLNTLNTGIARNSESIGQLGSFKAGSMGVLDSEMQAAASKGSFLRGVGGLASTIGSAWLGNIGGAAAIGSSGGKAALKQTLSRVM